MNTLAELAAGLASGKLTSRGLTDAALARIADPAGEGGRAFVRVFAESALAAADEIDRKRRRGASLSPIAGIPISIKDLFDVEGEVTTAGTVVLRDEAPARSDAPAVARLRAAGSVLVGHTNMTELAFSGVGINPHYGTPLNPWDRKTGRIPGGSSAGGAVSVCDGMAAAALGTDTGGSVRIPAALCGLTGFKPTQSRVPLAGAVPLSPSLDSIGPLGVAVECCALIDAILAGEEPRPLDDLALSGLRMAAPRAWVLEGMDATVSRAFEKALGRLSAAGVEVREVELAELLEIPKINRKGGLAAYESNQLHGDKVARLGGRMDPRVTRRIVKGAEQDEADYLEVCRRRADLIARVNVAMERFDAWVYPTVPIVAPALAEFEADAEYDRLNLLLLRNPSVVNFLDRCAVSIPCHQAGTAPVGLMVVGGRGEDRRVLTMGRAMQALFAESVFGRT